MPHLKKNPMYGYLMILVICASAGLQGWMALFSSYARRSWGKRPSCRPHPAPDRRLPVWLIDNRK